MANGDAYRADIDGLRAIAVVLVIFFHLTPRLLPNGFVGVDVFFVISGFVVAQSVMRRRSQRPGSDVLAFWKRRVARIYPALLVVLLVVSLGVVVLEPPFPVVVYRSLDRTALAAAVGVGNLYLHRSGTNYFLLDQSLNPLLHTWSLGIEEQFYVVFALVFILLPAMLARSARGVTVTRAVLLTTLTAGSLLWWFSRFAGNSAETYFLPQYRLWELGVGVLLALSSVSGRPLRAGRLLDLMKALACVSLVLLAAWPGVTNPNIAIAVATAVAGLALVAPPELLDGGGAARWLASAPARWVGLLSYSLYLWHWPVFIFLTMAGGRLSIGTGLIAAVATVALAAASYYVIENPLRRPQFPGYRLALIVGGLLLAIGTLNASDDLRPGWLYAGTPQAWSRDWLPPATEPYAGTVITQTACDLNAGDPVPVVPPPACSAPAMPGVWSTRSLLIVGDSFSFSDWGMVRVAQSRLGFRFLALAHDGCDIGREDQQLPDSCRAYWATMAERVRSTLREGDVVLLAAYWLDGSIDRSTRRVAGLADIARDVGASVIVQAPLPTFDRPAYLCTPEWFRFRSTGCSTSLSEVESLRLPTMARLDGLRQTYRNLRIWDPVSRLCPSDVCSAFSDSGPVYRDTDHLSYRAARSLGDPFADMLTASAAVPKSTATAR